MPISGTAIRADPLANWDYIPANVRPFFVRRFAIVGGESTGKTTMARHLAETFKTAWVPEYGRAYCEGRDPRTLSLADFEAIGRGQLAAEDAAAAIADKLLFCDTELYTTCTWSEMILNERPAWLAEAARTRRYHRVLLLSDEVPWVNDGTRVLGDRRAEHTRRLRAELESASQPFVELTGSFEARTDAAVRLVRST